MKKISIITIPILFVLAIVMLSAALYSDDIPFHQRSVIVTQHIDFFITSTGGLLAIISAILMLLRAVIGSNHLELVPLVLCLFAGLSIYSSDWIIPCILGVSVTSVLIISMWSKPEQI